MQGSFHGRSPISSPLRPRSGDVRTSRQLPLLNGADSLMMLKGTLRKQRLSEEEVLNGERTWPDYRPTSPPPPKHPSSPSLSTSRPETIIIAGPTVTAGTTDAASPKVDGQHPTLVTASSPSLQDFVDALRTEKELLAAGVGTVAVTLEVVLDALQNSIALLEQHNAAGPPLKKELTTKGDVHGVCPKCAIHGADGRQEAQSRLAHREAEVDKAQRLLQQERLQLEAERAAFAEERVELEHRKGELDVQWRELLVRQAETAASAGALAREWADLEMARDQLLGFSPSPSSSPTPNVAPSVPTDRRPFSAPTSAPDAGGDASCHPNDPHWKAAMGRPSTASAPSNVEALLATSTTAAFPPMPSVVRRARSREMAGSWRIPLTDDDR